MEWRDLGRFFASIIVMGLTSLVMAIFGLDKPDWTQVIVLAAMFTVIAAVREPKAEAAIARARGEQA